MGEKRGVFLATFSSGCSLECKGGLLLPLPSPLYSSVLPHTSSSCVGDGREGTSPTAGSTPGYLGFGSALLDVQMYNTRTRFKFWVVSLPLATCLWFLLILSLATF